LEGAPFLFTTMKSLKFILLGLFAFSLFISKPVVASVDKDSSAQSEEATSKTPAKGTGVRVDFFIDPLATPDSEEAIVKSGEALGVGFKITDGQSDYGVSDLHPQGWMYKRPSGQERPDDETCLENIKKFARGGVSVEAEGDLNNYFLLTLNADNSISILNPSINVATSNLLALIKLDGKVGDWFFDEPEGRIYVTMPEDNKVAVVDVFSRKLDRYIKVGKVPGQITDTQGGRYIFVVNNGIGTISVIDRQKVEVVRNIRIGKGKLEIEFDAESKFLFVADSNAGTVTVFNTLTLKKTNTVSVGKSKKIEMAYSSLSQALYLADVATGTVDIYHHKDGRKLKTIQMKPGIRQIRTSPKGRFVFVLNEKESSVGVIDTASNKISHSFNTWEKPYQVEFSDTFAYLRYKENSNISLVQLSALKQSGSPPFANVQMGVEGPGKFADLSDVSSIAIMPEGGGAMVVNPKDKMVYYYMESGMLAPSNSFKTYTDSPLGILIYDHSLQETTTAGTYSTTARFSQGGMYDVYFYLSSPRVTTCFEVKIEGPSNEKQVRKVPGKFISQFKDVMFLPGAESKVRFKLLGTENSKPINDLKDVRFLSFSKSSSWQVRQWAKPLGDGVYEADFTFPVEGDYHMLVECPSLGMLFKDTGYVLAKVAADNGMAKSK
jgi:YVTN family beta-propeller protein